MCVYKSYYEVVTNVSHCGGIPHDKQPLTVESGLVDDTLSTVLLKRSHVNDNASLINNRRNIMFDMRTGISEDEWNEYVKLIEKTHQRMEDYWGMSDKLIVECVLNGDKKRLKKVLKHRKEFEEHFMV